MSDAAISVSDVSKCYRVFDDRRSQLLHAVWPSHTKGMQEIWALKDINFEIGRGEAVAIIGRNGGGKSTLLEILTGILSPTTGSVKVNGRASALLELGSGFNPEYSGRDNVILNGLLLGLSKDDILSRFGEIEAFAEIGIAIDRPVKTYSTGMAMRLAFAVLVLCAPDILIVDEVLSVGDFFFQQKCMSYIHGLRAKGVTLVFVSHDMATVRDLCPRVLYLKQGILIFDGKNSVGIPLFFKEHARSTARPETEAENTTNVPGPEAATEQAIGIVLANAIWRKSAPVVPGSLIAVAVFDEQGKPTTTFRLGGLMTLRIAYMPRSDIINHVALTILDKSMRNKTTTGSLPLKIVSDKDGVRIFEISIQLMIEAGQYGLTINLGYETQKNRGQVIDETEMIGPIDVVWDYENETAPFLGQVGLPVTAKYIE